MPHIRGNVLDTHPYQVEGINEDFVPKNLLFAFVDEVVTGLPVGLEHVDDLLTDLRQALEP
jgi:O-acetylhomoserine/O-acetylserine sulfhydrylase-like pyridoxal-dependent enzyme